MRRAAPAFTAVVFDMDGLLLDSERPTRDAWLRTAAELGIGLHEADYLTLVGLNHTDSDARLLALFGADAGLLEHARARVAALLSGPGGARVFEPKPGVRRLLDGLRAARIPCAVASSTVRAEVRHRLDAIGLLPHFAVVCGGDEVTRGKPAPDLYTLALQRLGVAAASTLAFEDSGHGVQAALAAGLAVVAVPDLKAPDAAWLARCLAVLDSLAAVCELGEEWFGIGSLCPPGAMPGTNATDF